MAKSDLKNQYVGEGPALRLDSEDYGMTVSPEPEDAGGSPNGAAGREERKRKINFAVTLVLVLLLSAASFAILFVAKEIRDTGGIMPGTVGGNILGGSSGGGNVSETSEYGDYTERSAALASLPSTHVEWTNIDKNPDETGFFCVATEDEGERMVYNLDPNHVCGDYTLRDFNYIWVDSVNPGFYCLINIPGEVVDLSDYYILVRDDSGNLASRLIINCFEAKIVKLNNAIVQGTILAPNANVEYEGTVVYGDILAKAAAGERVYYKHIAYEGYALILKDVQKFEFTNPVVRRFVFGWLRENYPGQYMTYPDDYVFNMEDLAKVTELVLDGEPLSIIYDDLTPLVNLERLSLKNTKLVGVDLSGNLRLKYVDVSGTPAGYLIPPRSGSLEELYADNTNLYLLDTSVLSNAKVVSLTNDSFLIQPNYGALEKVEELYISGTGAGNEEIEKLSSLKNLKRLEAAENANVTSVDLRSIPYAEYADFSFCSVESISFEGALKLKEIKLNYNNMTDIDASAAPSLERIEAYSENYRTVTVKTGVTVYCMPETAVNRLEN